MTHHINHLPGRTIELDNSTFLFFSGTSYLGIGHQQVFRKALARGITKYGTIFSASRNGNLRLNIYDETEKFLTQQTGAEAALTVTSGAIAGQVAVTFLNNNFFIYAQGVHPAIWKDNSENIFLEEKDLKIIFEKDFEKISEKNSGKNSGNSAQEFPEPKSIVIAANAIDPLTCLPADWNFIKNLPNEKSITLLIDDSHGIGVTGENGSGIFQKIKNLCADKKNIRLIVVASLAKACGIPGGVILSDEATINALRILPLFVGASPIVPAYLQAFLDTQPMYDKARQRLEKNCRFFLSKLSAESKKQLRFLPNYPVFSMKDVALCPYLYDKGIFISQFAYPKQSDLPITRIIVSALHTEKDILKLAKAVNDFYKNKLYNILCN